jgi:DNA-binding response OmpR family regulator
VTSSVLVVEDDEKLGRQITQALTAAGFTPTWTRRGDDAMAMNLGEFSLLLLDLMLPGAHGFDVLKHARESNLHVPVLVLSARTDTIDKVRAFELGADDYMTKPFWPEELIARVRARLRRPVLDDATTVVMDTLKIDLAARAVSVAGADVDLTRVEFDLLAALARRPGAAVSRLSLVDHVLDPDRESDERTLDVHVSRLRKKLGDASRHVVTVWGVGYRLKGEA